MNGYLLTAGITQSQVRPTPGRSGQMVNMLQVWDSCTSGIIYGTSLAQAQKLFEAWCCQASEGENPVKVEIKKLLAAQFVDQLLTEAGEFPLDWPRISRQIHDALETTAADDFEQGYWVDINEIVRPGKISFDAESLKSDLPEGIRSGLNWSPKKQFFFVVCVLGPRPTQEIPAHEGKDDLDEVVAALSEMREKEAVAMVEARNSVVAAWLWRRFAAETRFASNAIQIDACCSFIPVE